MFDFGVQFCAHKNRESRDVEPEQKNDDAADRAVGRVVIAEVATYNLNTRETNTHSSVPITAPGVIHSPILLRVRSEVVDEAYRGATPGRMRAATAESSTPLRTRRQNRSEDARYSAIVGPAMIRVNELTTAARGAMVSPIAVPYFPPRSAFFDVVGAIQTTDDCNDGR